MQNNIHQKIELSYPPLKPAQKPLAKLVTLVAIVKILLTAMEPSSRRVYKPFVQYGVPIAPRVSIPHPLLYFTPSLAPFSDVLVIFFPKGSNLTLIIAAVGREVGTTSMAMICFPEFQHTEHARSQLYRKGGSFRGIIISITWVWFYTLKRGRVQTPRTPLAIPLFSCGPRLWQLSKYWSTGM